MPIGQSDAIGDIESQHAEEGDGEENRYAWAKEKSDPRYYEHLRVLVINLELRSTVQVNESLHRLLLSR